MSVRTLCVIPLLIWASAAKAVSLWDLAESDIVIVGRVSSQPPTPLRLQVLTASPALLDHPAAPEPPSYHVFALYDVDVLAVIKGKLDATKIRVLAHSNRPEDYGGRGDVSKAKLFSLPLGERLVLPLQEKRNGEYIVERQSSRVAATSVLAPADSDFAVVYLRQFVYHEFLIPPRAPADYGLKGDYPAWDLARVFVRSWRLTPDPERDIHETDGIWRLSLEPTSDQLRPLRGREKENADLRALIGPDPLGFYRKEILALLPPPDPDAPPMELLARAVVAASYGEPEAAGTICDMALAAPPEILDKMVDVVGGLARYPGGRDAAARLLSSSHSEIVMAALTQLGDPSVRSKYRDAVKRLLWHEHPGVLCRAITTLAFMDNETDRQATYGEDFSPGSKNAEDLEYWRNKP